VYNYSHKYNDALPFKQILHINLDLLTTANILISENYEHKTETDRRGRCQWSAR
jgi:hypothetical protein